MPEKLGNGGHGPENYDPATGKYTSEYHATGSGDLTRPQIDNPYSVDDFSQLAGAIEDEALDNYNEWALESIMKETGMGYADAMYFQDCLQDYLGGDFSAYTHGEMPKKTKVIDEGLSLMAKYDGEVYRGMSYNKSKPEHMAIYKGLMQKLVPGATFATNNLSSWTSDKGVGQGYANWDDRGVASVFFIMRRGKNKSGVGVKHISKFGDFESEVLFPSTARFKVVSRMSMPKMMSPGEVVDFVVVEEL